MIMTGEMDTVTMTVRLGGDEEAIAAAKAERKCEVCKHLGQLENGMRYCDRSTQRVFHDTGCELWGYYRLDGEEIIGVAIWWQGDLVLVLPCPKRHHHVIKYGEDVLGLTPPIGAPADFQGFYTASGRYLNRKEALEHVKETGQPLRNPNAINYLFSEDLW